jgi:hypothetical protein
VAGKHLSLAAALTPETFNVPGTTPKNINCLEIILEQGMNPLQSSPMHLLHGSPALSNDVEMLQTDVMRFFAILCLCLMAIFALVKALPMAPPADRPTIAEPRDLRAEAQSLQIQIATLRKKLAETLTQVQSASLAAEQSSIQVKKAANDEQEILNRLAIKQQQLKEVTQIKEETQNLEKIQAALDRANQKVSQSHPRNQSIPAKPWEADTSEKSARDGYILRFASDTALQTLISARQVNFYAVAGKKAWQLRLTGGRPGYISAKNPAQIYEMETATVPIDYALAFEQQVAAFGRSAVTWGVTLPAQTTASINRLIKGQKRGDLVIMPDGEVILN